MSDEILFKGSYGVLTGIIAGVGAYFGIKTRLTIMENQRIADQEQRDEDRKSNLEFRAEIREAVRKISEATTSTMDKVVLVTACEKCEKGNDAAIVSLRETVAALRDSMSVFDKKLTHFIFEFTHRRYDDAKEG